MRERGHVGVVHSVEDALCHDVHGLPECRMHRGRHDVETSEDVTRVVERPIRADVDLGADEDAERR